MNSLSGRALPGIHRMLVACCVLLACCYERFPSPDHTEILPLLGYYAQRWFYYNPASVAGLRFWIRAEDIAQSNNTTVNSWTDLSGTGNTVSAGTAPTFFSSANTINARPVVRFSGATVLSKASPVGLTSSDSGSIFVVVRTNAAAIDVLIFGSCGNQARQLSISTTVINPTKTCVTQAISAPFSWPVGTVHEVAWLQNLASYIEVRVDGSLVASGVPAVSGYGTGPLNISNASSMDIAEILFYDNQVSAQNARDIECYLGARYGTMSCP